MKAKLVSCVLLFLVAASVLLAMLLLAFWAYALSIPGEYENGGPTPFPNGPLGIAGAVLWIALIVAAAKAASCCYLLTEDLQAGQKLDGIEVVNPFQRGPDLIL